MSGTKVAFLLGAGISVASGLPTTKQITEVILSEIGLSATKRKSIQSNPGESEKLIELPFDKEILEFLKRLFTVANEHNTSLYWCSVNCKKKRHEVNYEDLFFMLNPVHAHLSEDYNPYGAMLIIHSDISNCA